MKARLWWMVGAALSTAAVEKCIVRGPVPPSGRTPGPMAGIHIAPAGGGGVRNPPGELKPLATRTPTPTPTPTPTALPLEETPDALAPIR
jgi:hypothetical protein